MASHPRVPRPNGRCQCLLLLGLAFAAVTTAGCFASAGVGPNADRPLETVDAVDLDRFEGRWYVIESIGTSAEAEAYDAVEVYTMRDNGEIDIEFRFHEGGFDGPVESIPQRGWIHDETTRAEWRVRPIWPLALDYLIIDLAPDYHYTVVRHPSKRWVWIMAREPALADATLDAIRGRLANAGYDVSRLRRVPQRPLGERGEL